MRCKWFMTSRKVVFFLYTQLMSLLQSFIKTIITAELNIVYTNSIANQAPNIHYPFVNHSPLSTWLILAAGKMFATYEPSIWHSSS